MNEQRTIPFLGMHLDALTWSNFKWDIAASSLFSFFNVAFNQFYVPIAIRHGASDFHVGILSAAPAFGLLFSPIWANMLRRDNVKRFMVWPNAIARLLLFIPAFFTDPWIFVTIALIFQFLMGIQAPSYAALVTQMYPSDLRGRLMGNVRVAMGVLMIPLAYGIGYWIDSAGSGGPLICAALLGFLSILIFAQVKQRPGEASSAEKRVRFAEQLRYMKGSKGLLIFFAATSLSGFGNMLANPLYSIIQVDHMKLANVEIGYIRMTYFAFLLVSYFTMGWIIDRLSPKLALMIGITFYTAVPLIYASTDAFPAVLLAGGLQGAGDAIWDIGCMAFVFRIAPGREAAVFGIHLMLFGIRGSIGPMLSTGAVHVLSYQTLLIIAGCFSLMGLLLFSKGGRMQASQQETNIGYTA